MKITPSRNININQSFKAATISINSFSDTHGNIQLADKAYQELKDKRDDVFCKEEKGKKNVFAICGDWFMDGAKKGYYSNPEKNNAFFQLDMLNAFITKIKKLTGNTSFLFTPGNHEFDGGVPLLDKILSKLDAKVLMTNLHIPTSNGLSSSISSGKIVNQEIVEVEDDKNPDLKHKVLFLGISPVNLEYYQKNCTGLNLLNNVRIAQKKVKEDDYQATMNDCKHRIEEFKKENPNGVVILMSHTGVEFADNLAKRADIDFVLDGHEHKEKIRYVEKTPIIPLSQNFKKMVNLKLHFNDDGEFSSYELKTLAPLKNEKKGELSKLYETLFHKDTKKQYSIISDSLSKEDFGIEQVRVGNSHLANFITDSILEEIRKEQPDVDFFGLNSSAIRSGLELSEKPSVSHFDVMNVLSGIKEEDGQIMLTEMSGKEVLETVIDNILFNSLMPTKNPIMQYSGLSVDKTAMLQGYDIGCELEDLYRFVVDTNTGKPIEADKSYIFANAEKYFDKTDNSQIKNIKKRSKKIGYTVPELFERHFANASEPLVAKREVRYK